jgi:PAS domain S-box-containing protein
VFWPSRLAFSVDSVTKLGNPRVTRMGSRSEGLNRNGLVMATNPAAKVLPFTPGQRSEERLFADAFEHAPNGMALLDSDGRITQASIAFCKILGYSQPALLGLGLTEITYSADIETEAEQRIRLAVGEIDRYQLVQRLVRNDGMAIWVVLSVSAGRRVSGWPKYYVIQVENGSQHRASGIGAAPDAFEDLLGEAVHEIRNTLTPLMVNTQLIVEQSAAGEIADSAHVILKAARRIAFTLRRLRGLNDLHSVAYPGDARMLDLRTIAPPRAD